MNTKVKKGIDIGAIVLFCIVFILGIFTVTIMITTKTTGVPSIFGYAFVDIQTPSMEGTLNVHDVAVIKICDVKKDNAGLKGATDSDVKNGDGSILTFWDDTITEDGSKVLNTHMVVEILYNTTGDPNSGIMAFRTQGTANEQEDFKVRLPEDVVGVYTGTRLAGFGNFTNFLQSWYGFLILIVLPLVAFLAWRIVILVKTAKEYKAEVNVEKEGTIENLEAQLAALKAQLTAGGDIPQGGAAVAAPLTAPVEAESAEVSSEVKPEEAAPEVESEKASSEVNSEEAAPVTEAADEVESEKVTSEVKSEEAASEAESEQASAKDGAAVVTQSSQEESAPKAEKKSTAGVAKKSSATKTATKTAAKSSASKTTTTKTAAKTSTAKTTAAKTIAKSSTAKSATAKSAEKTTTAKSATAKTSATKATASTAKKSTVKTTVKTDAAADAKTKAQGEEQ